MDRKTKTKYLKKIAPPNLFYGLSLKKIFNAKIFKKIGPPPKKNLVDHLKKKFTAKKII